MIKNASEKRSTPFGHIILSFEALDGALETRMEKVLEI